MRDWNDDQKIDGRDYDLFDEAGKRSGGGSRKNSGGCLNALIYIVFLLFLIWFIGSCTSC